MKFLKLHGLPQEVSREMVNYVGGRLLQLTHTANRYKGGDMCK